MDRQVQSGKKTVFLICFFIKYETKLVLICRFFIYNAQWAKNSAIKFQKLVLFCTFWDKFGNLYTYLGNH